MAYKPFPITPALAACAAAGALILAPIASTQTPDQCQSGGTPGNTAGPPPCEVKPPAVTGDPGQQAGPNTGGSQNGPYGPWPAPPIG